MGGGRRGEEGGGRRGEEGSHYASITNQMLLLHKHRLTISLLSHRNFVIEQNVFASISANNSNNGSKQDF
jgi:hypothetical protein